MTTDGRTENAGANKDPDKAQSEPLVDPARSTERDVRQRKPATDSKKKRKVERPETVAALFKYVYSESAAGRQLLLSRDLSHLVPDSESLSQEMELVRELAAEDPFLIALPPLLVAIADMQIEPPARERVLQLVLVALASHQVFEHWTRQLVDLRVEPELTAREISSAARTFTFDALSREERLEQRAAKRELLRVNAVTAFELLRVLRDEWATEQFIDDMCDFVWDAPSLRTPSAVALLASAKTDPLSQLARHFQARLSRRDREIAEVRERAAAQERRAAMAEERVRSMTEALESERSLVRQLNSQSAELQQLLATEQGRRFVESTHAAHDYEILRAQVIRQLSPQVNLLTDGLHALRNGSPAVAEEFVDRALVKIDSEVKRLKELEGESQ